MTKPSQHLFNVQRVLSACFGYKKQTTKKPITDEEHMRISATSCLFSVEKKNDFIKCILQTMFTVIKQ